jgi:hypothetical protein
MSKAPSPQYTKIPAVLFFFVATKERLAEKVSKLYNKCICFYRQKSRNRMVGRTCRRCSPSNFNVHSIISSSFLWPYPQGQAHIYKRSGTLTQSGSCNYEVSYTGKKHSDDNFTRIYADLNRLKVEVYNSKGYLLRTENFNF